MPCAPTLESLESATMLYLPGKAVYCSANTAIPAAPPHCKGSLSKKHKREEQGTEGWA